jgi:Skp family chaperone for outer membrane proteins
MKKMTVFCGALFLAAMAMVGCGPAGSTGGSSGGRGTVAVIDLDKVANTLGWIAQMNANLQAADADLKKQMEQVVQAGVKEIEDAKKKVVKDANLTAEQEKTLNSIQDLRELEKLPFTKDQREQLVTTLQKANNSLLVARNSYQQLMQGRRNELIVAFRTKIQPVARRVAAAHGMTVVLTTADSVLYFDPQTTDITTEVIDEMQKTIAAERAAMPAAAPAPATTPAPAPATTPAPETK